MGSIIIVYLSRVLHLNWFVLPQIWCRDRESDDDDDDDDDDGYDDDNDFDDCVKV